MCTVLRSRRGSSPLARGLLPPPPPPGWPPGIIPARAGFTHVHPEQSDTPEDHPRSRGVYSQDERVSMMNAGSSPLARGLRIIQIPQECFARIIPARAGFTLKPL